MAETPTGGSGRNAIALSGDGGRLEPGGPERTGRQDATRDERREEWSGPALDGSRPTSHDRVRLREAREDRRNTGRDLRHTITDVLMDRCGGG